MLKILEFIIKFPAYAIGCIYNLFTDWRGFLIIPLAIVVAAICIFVCERKAERIPVIIIGVIIALIIIF